MSVGTELLHRLAEFTVPSLLFVAERDADEARSLVTRVAFGYKPQMTAQSNDSERGREILASLPISARQALRKRASAPVRTASELRLGIPGYLTELEDARKTNEFVDIDCARDVAARCLTLLYETADRGDEAHWLARVAAEYFLAEDDGEHDTDSIIGFDDDLAVVIAVAAFLDTREGFAE